MSISFGIQYRRRTQNGEECTKYNFDSHDFSRLGSKGHVSLVIVHLCDPPEGDVDAFRFPRSFIGFFGFWPRFKRHKLLLPLTTSLRSTERVFILSASQLLASTWIPEEGLRSLQPQTFGLHNPKCGAVLLYKLMEDIRTGHLLAKA